MSQRRPGFTKLFEIRNVPVFVHWSLPIGGFVVSAFGGFDLADALYYSVGVIIVITVHELGHAAAASFLGLRIYSMEILGLAGLCRIQAPAAPKAIFLLFSAGVLAQLPLMLLTVAYLSIVGVPESDFWRCICVAFIIVNPIIMLFALIPAKGMDGNSSDGLVLWKLILHVCFNRPHPLLPPSRVYPSETSLLTIPGFLPVDFQVGIEILNDTTTTMEFVVETLTTNMNLDRDAAIQLMLAIHTKGGVLVPLATSAEAATKADSITQHAKERGFSFTCRAVDARLVGTAG